jgi:molybdenum cofactor cytidylyltransferase
MIARARSAAVVTAAGLSSRMGWLKALLDWNGVPLLQYQVDCLRDWGEVCVVLGHEAAQIQERLVLPDNAKLVIHAGYREGRASSLRAGFEALGGTPEAVLVVGVDQPLEARCLDLLSASMQSEDAIAIPVSEGRRGHPVLFAGKLLDELKAIREEDAGLRAVVRRHPVRQVPVPGPFWDLNLPEDYAAARDTVR